MPRIENAADLCNAAEKYDIQDILEISKKFMIEHCHEGNNHFLLKTAKMFNLPDLEKTCKTCFMKQTYKVLSFHFNLTMNDETLSELFALKTLSIENEFELYLALEIMVQSKKLSNYSKCLSKIRFLTMETRDVLICNLLSPQEKNAVAANIEAINHQEVAMLPMPSRVSTETKSRCTSNFE